MIIPTLTGPLLYALLSINPAAVSTLSALPSRSDSSVARQDVPNPTPDLVNATVSCREGEFQDPDSDIQDVVCGDYYECAGGSEAERLDPDGDGGEVAVWTATCFDCRAGQSPDKASGCVYTPT
jgi:hypothetical protein